MKNTRKHENKPKVNETLLNDELTIIELENRPEIGGGSDSGGGPLFPNLRCKPD